MSQGQSAHNASGQINEIAADSVKFKPARVIPRDFLPELQSAASMIMSREECAEIEKELQHLLNPRSAAA